MSQIIAIPVKRMSAKVVLEKGRGWSAVDELILWSLSKTPMSAGVLAERSKLPRRVIIEMIVRMMRFRLIEAVLVDGVPAFQTTDRGSAVVASGEQIPTAKRRMSRHVSFVVDRITGTVFPKGDVRLEMAPAITFLRNKGFDVRDVEVIGTSLMTSPKANIVRFQKVLRRDESLLFFDGDTVVEREDEFMMVTVDGDAVDGIPERTPATLLEQIRLVAKSSEKARPIAVASLVRDDDESGLPALRPMQFEDGDLIFDHDEHRRAFARVLGSAKRRILLHSTFLRKDAFLAWRPDFRAAVRRGALVDVFWGAGTTDKPNEKTIVEATAIANEVARDDVLRERVRIHLRSTGSHSKLLIADDGEGGYAAVVGSCNWLYTGFDRFELSLRLQEPGLVADVMDRFSALVAKPGFRPEIGAELFITARKMRERGAVGGSHHARIIAGTAHEAILREASGAPAGRFVVASDKLGNSAFPNAIIPAEVAAAAVNASPIVVYGETTGKVTGKGASEMTHDVRERGVRLLRVSKGFHAKFLLWGDDDAVITSLNWCSWTTNADAPNAEIGVHVKRTGVARDLEMRLKLIWPELN
jgi:cardiolipin synthase A/B